MLVERSRGCARDDVRGSISGSRWIRREPPDQSLKHRTSRLECRHIVRHADSLFTMSDIRTSIALLSGLRTIVLPLDFGMRCCTCRHWPTLRVRCRPRTASETVAVSSPDGEDGGQPTGLRGWI